MGLRDNLANMLARASGGAAGLALATPDQAEAGILPPRIGLKSGRGGLPEIAGNEGVPLIHRLDEWAPRPFFEMPVVDPRGPWGQPMPPVSPLAKYVFPRPPGNPTTDAALAAIQAALKTRYPSNSGVPLVPLRGEGREVNVDNLRAHIADLLGDKSVLAGVTVGAGAAPAPDQAQAAPQFPFRPTATIADALASLAGRGTKDQVTAAASALREPGPPAPPPMPQRPASPPSQFAPMPVNPASPPPWVKQHLLPHLSEPYQGRLPPTIATNAAGKTYPPEMTHPWQGWLADTANLATNLIGAGF